MCSSDLYIELDILSGVSSDFQVAAEKQIKSTTVRDEVRNSLRVYRLSSI